MIRTDRCETLAALYLRATQWKGDAPLFVDAHERIGGQAALDQSLRTASALGRLAPQGGAVAFLCGGSARHAVAWFGAVLAGRPACNLHTRETAAHLARTLDWLGATVLVYDEALQALAHAACGAARSAPALLCLGQDAQAALDFDAAQQQCAAHPVAQALPRPDDLAAIVLSSGSTGQPKGVMHSQRTLLEAAKAGQYAFAHITDQHAVAMLVQPSFAAWFIIGLPFVGARAKLVFAPRFEPEAFLSMVERERITLAPLVPTMWRMLFACDTARRDLSSLRLASIGGEPPAVEDIQRLDQRICRQMVSFYVSSEAGTGGGVHAWRHELLEQGKAAAAGYPGLGVDLKIIDPAGGFDDELPAGEVGEIAVSGPSLALGYWQDPETTAERFRCGWWRSGDLGRLDADGCLWVHGRIDNLINSGGIKVAGEEVERALLAHPDVAHCAVVGQPDARLGQRVEAYVVLHRPLSAAALEAFCRGPAGLAGFKVPKVFHLVDALPTGPTGKLQRRALRQTTPDGG